MLRYLLLVCLAVSVTTCSSKRSVESSPQFVWIEPGPELKKDCGRRLPNRGENLATSYIPDLWGAAVCGDLRAEKWAELVERIRASLVELGIVPAPATSPAAIDPGGEE